MPPEIKWNDAEEIGIQLQEKYPDLDPLTVRFTELHKYVTELPGFADDPANSNESKLEAIQMAWYDEYKDASEERQ
jgi:FeS assembly protein IscX